MSLRSGSRQSLKSAPGGGRQRLLPRAESAKSIGGMQVTGTAYYQQMREVKQIANNKNSAQITEDDLLRIKQQCWMSKEDEENEFKAKERKEMQDKSKARVKNWPNTIDAMRFKREQEKMKRLEDEEIERRRLDAEEDALAQDRRLVALENANKKMHDQQDQVKAFHSKMLLCDVIQEREAQQELKKRKENIDKQVEEQWHEMEQRKMDEFDEKTQKKIEEYYNKKRENAKVIKTQLTEFKMTHIKRIKEQMLEGELIKRKAKEDLELDQRKQLERKVQQAKTREQLTKANEALKVFNEELKRKEAIEGKKIEEFAMRKDRLDQLRKDKEAQKFKEKQDQRQQMIDKQIEYLSKLKNREEEILNKQVAEAEEKAAAQFQEQERKRQMLKEQIERSRKLQMDKRLNEKETVKRDEKEFADFWKIRNDELQIAEEQEKEEIRQRQAELKNYQRSQVEVKKKKVEDNFMKELQDATNSNALLDQKEKEFYSYAEQCIREWQDTGKNVKPLILELKNYKKRSLYQ